MKRNNLKEFKQAIKELKAITPQEIEDIHQEGFDYGVDILDHITGFCWYQSYAPCEVLLGYYETGEPLCDRCIWMIGTNQDCTLQIPCDFYDFFESETAQGLYKKIQLWIQKMESALKAFGEKFPDTRSNNATIINK